MNRTKNDLLSKNQLFVNLGYHFSYQLNPRFALRAQPDIGYIFLNKQDEDFIFTIEPFNVGFDLRVTYRLMSLID